ncbi:MULTISPECIES: histidinol-phosphate transaminase [Acidithiobacillus]|uniref:Histidinol-phosphate aminotransferase n=2 Tax=Acidithiobacillus TaxID=119977 RepID=A0A179B730_ACIFR|nr:MULTISPECIES: histidinol-phosphate transaminase [Acidithiobacillus]MDA8180939.1 histidinol-phosphate transaminase [Acidithiobacillus sp.]MBU2853205.1 histidinol-phosphate transaminase [Acidithiobacillus ferriphilus]MEB8488096.1 histidinol-phosphate transaminase [Acidithiobacillus ferriphilus]MEB8490377.1 histidinol-phosphate transaminase [Acidithiobacillus ferriphilus]MEB8492687.1 histidinol-phosphate transaminase [Acidithiobacillus ferriphilus]
MCNKYLEYAAAGVSDLRPYQPGKPLAELEREQGIRDAIKLASNENPLGPGPMTLAAIRAALPTLALYPEGSAPELRALLARQLDLDPRQFIFGNGSDQVVEFAVRAFAGPGTEVIVSQYAFAAYAIAAQASGATVRIAPARNYGHDLEAMAGLLNAQTRLVFIANPNNPTGTYLTAAALETFIDSVPSHALVVLDEAYLELMDAADYPDGKHWLRRFGNLMLTRTFSKAYGLAGLRCGYGIGHPDLIAVLERVRQPFNVNTLAQVAAHAALTDLAHLRATLANNHQGMVTLRDGLHNLGLTILPPAGNFTAFAVPGGGQRVYDALLQRGVIIRPLIPYGMPDHLRVSVGLPVENQRFLKMLGEVL